MKTNLPCLCPSCGSSLKVRRLACDRCGTAVEGDYELPLLARLDSGDQQFILNLLTSGGSLKELAALYGISYPTVRNRLDALIEKVQSIQNQSRSHGPSAEE
ncbi:DUF2089 domain-containing protein [bacterium]|nr:DUF2089 domain-containing protein [bacterium]